VRHGEECASAICMTINSGEGPKEEAGIEDSSLKGPLGAGTNWRV